MTEDDQREKLELALQEIRTMFADMHMLRRKLREIKQNFREQRDNGKISRFRYTIEMTDVKRLEQTTEAQWLRLQQQRNQTLARLQRLA